MLIRTGSCRMYQIVSLLLAAMNIKGKGKANHIASN